MSARADMHVADRTGIAGTGHAGRRPALAWAHRPHPLWLAFALHRLSGLALALFLPVHFHMLAMAVTDRAALEGLLALGDHPLVKLAEGVLVFLLAVHLFGGLRLIAFEWVPGAGRMSDRQKTLAAAARRISHF